MGIDDLPRDRKPEPRMVAEMLGIGPVGIEALEDAADIAADARPLVGHRDGDRSASVVTRDAHRAALGRERHGIVDEVVEDLRQPAVMADDDGRVPAVALLQHDVDACGSAARSFWIETIASASFSMSTRSAAFARQLGVEPAGVGDVGDQPVEAAHVVLDDGVEPLAVLGALGPRQRLDGASAARSAGS